MRVVDTVPGSEVDLQLGHTIGQIPVSAGITVNQPVNTNLNPGSSCPILECIDPFAIGFRLFDTYIAL